MNHRINAMNQSACVLRAITIPSQALYAISSSFRQFIRNNAGCDAVWLYFAVKAIRSHKAGNLLDELARFTVMANIAVYADRVEHFIVEEQVDELIGAFDAFPGLQVYPVAQQCDFVDSGRMVEENSAFMLFAAHDRSDDFRLVGRL